MAPITPHRYQIDIAPDLDQYTFTGSVTIEGTVAAPTDSLWLHALGLKIDVCRLTAGDVAVAAVAAVDDTAERLTLTLARTVSGPVTLHIDYHGILNDQMAGFYRSGYVTENGPAVIAVTQFQESDARRAFPCIDHPAAKAEFDIALIVDTRLCAISNMPATGETAAESGKKRVVFARTPKMSTYLVFFSVGDYRITTEAADPRVRSVVLPGRESYGDYGRDFGGKALDYCERYTGIPYPLEKMDLIAIPDFAFGAMENWGAITFRENLLLYDPEKTSSAGKERICEVTAHEVVHQWFGNLVTPSDWRYLWLNESFATYFGFGIVDHYYPEWKTWHQFLNGQTGTAMKRDALPGTVAIEIPGGEHVVINSSTAPIIYNKGASILRHIRGYIGDAHFQKGLSTYLNRHAYANAASDDFWQAFESVSDHPVAAIMKSWIAQPGFPLLEVSRENDGLRICQRRFSYLPEAGSPRWQIPVTLAFWHTDGHSWQQTLLLTDAETLLPLPEAVAAYKLNAGQTGFYRTHYKDDLNAAALERMAASGQLTPEDQWGLQGDLYELVKSGARPLERYLAFVAACSAETRFLPVLGMTENLFEAFRVVAPPARDRVRDTARGLVQAALDAIGLTPAPHEPQPLTTLRDQLLWQAVCYGIENIRERIARRFESLKQGRPIHPDLMKSTLQTGAAGGDRATLAWFVKRFSDTGNEHQRMDLLTAMGAFADTDLLDSALAFGLADVPERNRFLLVAAVAANPQGDATLWRWYLNNLGKLEKGHPLLYERMVIAVILGAGLTQPDAVRAFFLDYRSRPAAPVDAIDLALGKLAVNLKLLEKSGEKMP
ncbi:MAG: M1 family metallopeptidase [Pseudomonadota bacterium]